jgi:tetratricopeptide (TPR) repeat protein
MALPKADRWRARAVVVAILLNGLPSELSAQPTPQHDPDLGKVEFAVSCSAAAQTEFNRAVALLHHMTYPQAREAFQRVGKLDPECAMAHWGVAMTLFQPLWPTRPGAAELRRGWEAVQVAEKLAPSTERELLFIQSAAAFFQPDEADYWQRIRRWEAAVAKVHAAFPQDPEATAFYALAHLAVAPFDEGARAFADRAAELLLAVHEKNPDHPGAMHYLVHANDAVGRERKSPDVVRKYEASAPRNPHALHMPTHIFVRLGNWPRVVRGNLQAAEAALAHPAGDAGQFVWDEFPHAIEYLIYAHLQQGADQLAAAQVRRLVQTARLEPTFKTAFHLASTQARYALERRAWSEAMALRAREPATLTWDQFKWAEAVTWFARGLGAVHLRDSPNARAAAARLAELETAAGTSGEALFARHIRVLRLGVDAWLIHAAGKRDSSVTLMRGAVALEESTPKHPVTPAPTLPASELLGDLLLEQARPTEALAAYQHSLTLYPRRFNGLLGVARAARALGNASVARSAYEELLVVAEGSTRRAALQEARDFLAGPR